MRSILVGVALAGAVLPATLAMAHAPVLDCFVEKESGSVKCEAGFSDGTSAAGKKLAILDAQHKLIQEGVLDATGSFTFKAPGGEYHVVFRGGENHEVTIYSTDIS